MKKIENTSWQVKHVEHAFGNRNIIIYYYIYTMLSYLYDAVFMQSKQFIPLVNVSSQTIFTYDDYSKRMNLCVIDILQLTLRLRLTMSVSLHSSQIIIIISIKKGQQCKTGREWYTPYQSEDLSPTIPTYRQKEEKGKESRRL